jgi:hypothetical protein
MESRGEDMNRARRSDSNRLLGVKHDFNRLLGVKHMVSPQRPKPPRAQGDTVTVGRLFLLDLSDDRIVSLNSDGSDRKVDVADGHIYWTNMGVPNANDGSIERADLDGRNRQTIVAPGGTFTPKQIQLEKRTRKLYWCDHEGMRVMRANLDGGQFYWTQKGPDNAGKGCLCRVGIEIPTGRTASNRADIEVLYDGLPEPIDLNNRVMYWTDRGDPPRGNTLSTLDLKDDRMVVTDFGGNALSAKLDGSEVKSLLVAQGNLTGIAYAEIS